MLQKRRVFDLTNSIVNYLFLVLLLLCGIYAVSFWIELTEEFTAFLVLCINVMTWTVSGLSVILVLLALVIAVLDRDLRFAALLWSIIRMIICVAFSIIIDAASILVSEGVSLRL